MFDTKNLKIFVSFFAIGFTVYVIYIKMIKSSYEGEAATQPEANTDASQAQPEVVNAAEPSPAEIAPVKTEQIVEAAALLPKDTDAAKSLQELLKSQDLLISGFASGINQSANKNPNLQLRSDPIIPMQDISPFNQSSIQPDVFRKKFEIE